MKWQKKTRPASDNIFGEVFFGRDFQVKKKLKEWEFFIDPQHTHHEGERRHEYVGNFLSAKKAFVFSIFLFLGFFLIFFRLFYLQIIEGDHFRSLAEGNRLKIITTKAQRGLMYDQKNRLLVQNIPGFIVFLDPTQIPTDTMTQNLYFDHLSLYLSLTRDDLFQKFQSEAKKNNLFIISEDLDYENAILLKIHEKEFPGMILEAVGFRQYYPDAKKEEIFPQSLSHILGYVGILNTEEYREFQKDANTRYHPTDIIGKTGLEKQYESLLKGENGEKRVEVDARGKEKKVFSNKESIAGKNLFLSVDLVLQEKVQDILLLHLEKNRKTRASVVVLNPGNGEILAMVSTPLYDNNLFSPHIGKEDYKKLITDADKPLFFRAISGMYPSGSTIKPVLGFAALEENVINSATTILSMGGIRIGQWFFPDWKAGGHGRTNIFDAIANSVNTFFYIIGGGFEDFSGLGDERMKKYMELFGLGKKLGIDLPGEADGLVPSSVWKQETKHEKWYIGDTYHMAIGQGDLLVTPLQVAAFTSVFANFGTLFEPHVARGYGETYSEVSIKDDYILQKFSSANIEIIRKAMRETVLRGSARRLLSLPISSAGKTGTAEWNSEKSPHAWFTSFAPYENPELVVTVLVEEGGGGESVALPIAYDIYDWYFREYKK